MNRAEATDLALMMRATMKDLMPSNACIGFGVRQMVGLFAHEAVLHFSSPVLPNQYIIVVSSQSQWEYVLGKIKAFAQNDQTSLVESAIEGDRALHCRLSFERWRYHTGLSAGDDMPDETIEVRTGGEVLTLVDRLLQAV